MRFERPVVAAMAALTLLAAPAIVHAQSVSFTDTVVLQPTNFNSTVSLSKFNAALGTLTSINFTLAGNILATAKGESLDAAPTTITLNSSATITLTRPDTSTIAVVVPVNTQTFNASAYDGTIDFGGTSGVTRPNLTASASASATSPLPVSDLSLFTGTGNILLPVLAVGSSNATGAGNLITQFNTSAGATVTVTYNYRAAAVPEPGSVAMLVGVGVSGAGFLIRRRRK